MRKKVSLTAAFRTVLEINIGNQCWCGHEVNPMRDIIPRGNCNNACSGDSSENCGGFNSGNVYRILRQDSSLGNCSAQINLLTNGNFETGCTSTTECTNVTPTGWTVTDAVSGVERTPKMVRLTSGVAGGSQPAAPAPKKLNEYLEGSYALDLNVVIANIGYKLKISQTVAVTSGWWYLLSFKAFQDTAGGSTLKTGTFSITGGLNWDNGNSYSSFVIQHDTSSSFYQTYKVNKWGTKFRATGIFN